MVKRLESSFSAFKTSLHTFLRITNDMIGMFEHNKILIAPDYDVKGMMAKYIELDDIIEKIVNKGVDKDDFVYQSSDFLDIFLPLLKEDKEKLTMKLTNEEYHHYINDKHICIIKYTTQYSKGEISSKVPFSLISKFTDSFDITPRPQAFLYALKIQIPFSIFYLAN